MDPGDLLADFLPMFEYLSDHDVDYCVVGGLGVALQCMANGEALARETHDADLMLSEAFTNEDFARAYLAVYGSGPQPEGGLYGSLFPEGLGAAFPDGDAQLENCSFCGPLGESGAHAPDFDVVRSLNGFSLRDLDTQGVEVGGVRVKVASAGDLLEMKKRTIALLGMDAASTPRGQDYIDAAALDRICPPPEDGEDDRAGRSM